jgi:small subunit ribosomal protein S19
MAKEKTIKGEEILKSKDQFYRGVNLNDLKNLDVRESAKYLPSRSRRTVLRNFDKVEKFVKRCEALISQKKKVKTHLRDMVVVPKMVGMTIGIHNGKQFNETPITVEMIGHRLGEFSLSRGRVNHGEAGIGATKSSKALKK